ncbi:Aspartate-semialdehyde dehydrogenase 2 [Rickettsiales bacterium Ac37b]|nr:Aspartate-semialdehyde dehydrogenase 2 [Rickettsiales bacterium Ac37b]
MSYKIAVVGATGNVGREMLNILAERQFPVKELVALASRDSLGKELSFGEKDIVKVQALDGYDFSGTNIALFSPGASISKHYAPIAAKSGCIVIDNTSYFRMHNDIPLVVTEVNPNDIALYNKTNIISNPNCTTIQMLVALKPIDEIGDIKRIVVSTYQSVSGAGKEAMDELYNQTKNILMFQGVTSNKFSKQIAFNIIPHIDDFLNDGYTKEEHKIMNETKKIMGKNIEVTATCIRVPVFVGHGISVNIECNNNISENELIQALEDAPGIVVLNNNEEGGYATPIDVVQDDYVYVSRIRRDKTLKNAFNLWIVSDNLRKGAALNAIQIAELLTKNYSI